MTWKNKLKVAIWDLKVRLQTIATFFIGGKRK